MKDTTYISVIVYITNNYIDNNIIKLDDFLDKHFAHYEIVLVNDTGRYYNLNKCSSIKERIKGNVMIIDLWEKHGVDKGLFAGTDICMGDFIYEIEDLNLDYSLELIMDMYKKSIKEGYDIVYLQQDKPVGILSKSYNYILKSLTKDKPLNNNSRVRLVTRRALYKIEAYKNQDICRNIMYMNSGFKFTTINYNSNKSTKGDMTYKVSRVRKDLRYLIIYTDELERLPFIFSMLFFIASIITTIIHINYPRLINGLLNTSWIVLFSILLGFSFVLFSLGIVNRSLKTSYSKCIEVKAYKVSNVKRLNKY